MSTLRSIDQIIGLVDDGQYQTELISRIEDTNIDMRQFAQDFGAAKVSIKLSIDIKIDRFGQLELTVDDKITHSQPPKRKGVAWLTGQGSVSNENPAQARMQIRDVGTGAKELRAAGFPEVN